MNELNNLIIKLKVDARNDLQRNSQVQEELRQIEEIASRVNMKLDYEAGGLIPIMETKVTVIKSLQQHG